jgi:hypothetical protein
MKKLNNISAFVFIVVVIIFSINGILRQKKNENLIQIKGVYCKARIVKKMVTSHATPYLKYFFVCKNIKIYNERAVSRDFYDLYKISDTIIVKISQIENNIESVICQKIKYNRCMGNQPLYGWKYLPKCLDTKNFNN